LGLYKKLVEIIWSPDSVSFIKSKATASLMAGSGIIETVEFREYDIEEWLVMLNEEEGAATKEVKRKAIDFLLLTQLPGAPFEAMLDSLDTVVKEAQYVAQISLQRGYLHMSLGLSLLCADNVEQGLAIDKNARLANTFTPKYYTQRVQNTLRGLVYTNQVMTGLLEWHELTATFDKRLVADYNRTIDEIAAQLD
jgi:hypothetical protein